MLSPLLQRLQDGNVISPAIAQRLNALESEALQLQAVKELPEAFNQATDQLVNRLSGKDVQVLYEQTPAAPLKTRMWEDIAEAAGETLATEAIPGGWGEMGGMLRRWIRQAWQWGKTSAVLKWVVALWLLSLAWSGVVNWMGKRAELEPLDQLSEPMTEAPVPLIPELIPLEPQGTKAASPAKPTKPTNGTLYPPATYLAPVPAPKNLRWSRTENGAVRLVWDAPAKLGLRYNVYVRFAGDASGWDTGNDQPLAGPEIVWTPPAEGVPVFEMYLKAVDAQGRESAPSNHVIADLR